MMMKESPRNCQIVMRATEGRAQVGVLERRRVRIDAEPRQQAHHRVHQGAEHHRATATELTTVEEKIIR